MSPYVCVCVCALIFHINFLVFVKYFSEILSSRLLLFLHATLANVESQQGIKMPALFSVPFLSDFLTLHQPSQLICPLLLCQLSLGSCELTSLHSLWKKKTD